MTQNRSHSGPVVFDASLLEQAPKPGSRRARRMAERARVSQSADTAEIPVVAQVVTAGETPYVEHMNFHLVTSRLDDSPVKRRRSTKSMYLAGAASLAVFAAGGVIFPLIPDGTHPERAVAAVVPAPKAPASTPVASAVSFEVTADGKTTKISAKADQTYASALANAGISVGPRDEVSVSLSKTVTTEPVKIVRVTTKTLNEDVAIAYETTRVETADLPKGEEKVTTEGKEGKGTRSFQVTYRDGEESARMLLVETVASAPVAQVVAVGTREKAAPAASPEVGRVPAAAPVPAGSARQIAQGMLASYGWGMDQWSCLDALWQRESHWNFQAMNRASGAYGIPQALPGSKMASAGADWQTNPATQIKWGLGYILGRYGSPCGAWNHSQSRGWY